MAWENLSAEVAAEFCTIENNCHDSAEEVLQIKRHRFLTYKREKSKDRYFDQRLSISFRIKRREATRAWKKAHPEGKRAQDRRRWATRRDELNARRRARYAERKGGSNANSN